MAGTAERHGCSAALIRCVCVCPLSHPFACMLPFELCWGACSHMPACMLIPLCLHCLRLWAGCLVAHSLSHVPCMCHKTALPPYRAGPLGG